MTVGGIVLAGGRSTRMGQDKALLDWGGVPLVAHVCERVRAAIDGPLVVVVARDQTLPRLAGVSLVADLVSGRGPLEGLRTGLAALAPEVEAAFVTSVDAPGLQPEFIHALVSRLGDAEAVLPATDGMVHPLTGVYRTSLIGLVGELLDAGERRARSVGERCRAVIVEREELLGDDALRAADPQLFSLVDIDTPGDLLAARGRDMVRRQA